MKIFIITIFLFSILNLFSQDVQEPRTQKKFNIPATEFIPSGFKFSFSGTTKASHSSTGGARHLLPYSTLAFLSSIFRVQNAYNLNGGQVQRDNVLTENIESYSYFNQPYEKISPLGKVSTSFTTKSSEWTFDISFRAKNYSGDYTAGSNIPFEYFPGKMQYNWREGQYSIIRNHALFSFLMVQPQIGVREITEKYSRSSDTFAYPLGKNYSSVKEYSKTFSHQAGLTFHFKFLENLRLKVTGKIFQGINGEIKTERDDYRFDGTNYYGRNIQSKLARVYTNGNELEGEISYALKSINFFTGYNFTKINKSASRDPNENPIITTNENLTSEYLKYYIADAVYSMSSSNSENHFNNTFFGTKDQAFRYQHLKYLYFGVSVNF
jgi:hypothetical protein